MQSPLPFSLRPPFVALCFALAISVAFPLKTAHGEESTARAKPNVLMIAVDDLNDWVGCLGGHPQARTPHIDELASRGMLFSQAYCAAPLCHPSRTAILTGLHPSNTGVYDNQHWFRDVPGFEETLTLPQYFRQHGYTTHTGGKIFHQPFGKWSDPLSWDEQYSTSMGTPAAPKPLQYMHGLRAQFDNKILARLIDWMPLDVPIEDTADWKTADLAASFFSEEHDKPFFLACGIYRPHLQWYAPRPFFEMHPLDSIVCPTVKQDDLEDVPEMGRKMSGKEFEIIRRGKQWPQAVQGYLASCSFADACVGHVLRALEASAYRDNTIVVLWGDHGYHLGDKLHWAKSALWEQTTRTPLIVYVPPSLGIAAQAPNQASCASPVSLIDLYPTLIDLCDLPPKEDLDGESLRPLLAAPTERRSAPVVITHSPHWHGFNHAIRRHDFHFIRYHDGGEELYDTRRDPHQWTNLAGRDEYAKVLQELRTFLPKNNVRHAIGQKQ